MRFDEYVEAQHVKLLRFSTVLTGDGRLAEDLVQTVLFRAFEQWERVSSADSEHAYVRRMIVNEYLSWRRKRLRPIPVANLDEFMAQVPDHAEQHAERLSLVHSIARLPARQRTVVVLRYYEELSDGEIAAVLGVGESTVRSNLSRALAALRVEVAPASRATTPKPVPSSAANAAPSERP